MSKHEAHPVKIEIYDDVGDVAAVLESFDEVCVTVDIRTSHTEESWNDLSTVIAESISNMTKPLKLGKE